MKESRSMLQLKFDDLIEYDIFGEGSHISTNQKRDSTVFSSDWLKFETLPRGKVTNLPLLLAEEGSQIRTFGGRRVTNLTF